MRITNIEALNINYWKSNYKIKSERNLIRLIMFYTSIISKGERNIEFTERHHMIPKCMNYNNIEDTENLIVLTPKEHFIAHLILSKCFVGREEYKTRLALDRMKSGPSGLRDYKSNAKLYEQNRIRLNSLQCEKIAITNGNETKYVFESELDSYYSQGYKKGKDKAYGKTMSIAKSDKFIFGEHECYGSRNMRDYLRSIGYNKISQLAVQKLSSMMPVNGYEELLGKVLKVDRNTGEITDTTKINLSNKKPRGHRNFLGKYCVTNGKTNKHIDPSELKHYESLGWWRGNHKKNVSDDYYKRISPKGRMWINNGEINKLVYPNDFEKLKKDGFIKGKLTKQKCGI